MRESGIFPNGQPPVLQQPKLGEIQGRYNKGVIQYLGLKYASLEYRFVKPELQITIVKSDAMKHGPPVLTHEGACATKMSFIQAKIPAFDLPPVSDTDRLNLNITVPLEGDSSLPVLVYIHGGGYVFGSGTHPHYDQSKVVELSSIMDRPIVAVNLKYELHSLL